VPSGAGRSGNRKLTFSDRHALETLPARIAALSDDINRLAGALSDPTLYSRDPARFARLSEELAAAEVARTEAEDRWLELEVRREEIEG
jgi:ATP-binding cassette subfamily F protein uup